MEAMTGHRIIEDSGRNVDRAELAQAISALSGMSAETIRETAAEAWRAEFGGALPPISSTAIQRP